MNNIKYKMTLLLDFLHILLQKYFQYQLVFTSFCTNINILKFHRIAQKNFLGFYFLTLFISVLFFIIYAFSNLLILKFSEAMQYNLLYNKY